MRMQISRLNLPENLLYMYGINKDGKTPKPKKQAEWLLIARTFILGDEKAESRGFPPVTNPSAKEIEEKLTAAEKVYAEIAPADRDYDTEQAVIAEMREKTNTLIKDIMAELRYTLRNLDVPSRRRIKRSYGVVYKQLEKEDAGENDMKEKELEIDKTEE